MSGQSTAHDAVFFDLDDTLYDQASPFAYAVERVLGPLPGVSATELFETSRRYSQEIFAAYRHDQHPTDAMYIRRMRKTLGAFGVKIGDERALELQHVYGCESRSAMKLAPAMEEALSWCREHTASGLGIITNGKVRPQRQKFEILGLGRWILPEHVFISDELGYAKPQAELFEIACKGLGAAPERSLYVGDAFAIDVLGAHAVHMPAIWFNHRLRPAPRDQFPADYEVHTATELRDLLERIV